MDSIKLSVLDLVPLLEQADAKAALEQSITLAQFAEKLGYFRYWVAEHHDMTGIVSSCPEVLLSHVGARTERIRIGSGAVLLPYYKPYKVAETFHMLATLYPNRVDLGVGRAPGGSAHVSLALSDNYLEQVRRIPDSVEQLTKLLHDEYDVEGQRVSARPVPAVPPQLWMLGTSEKSALLAAKLGTGYVFGHFMSDRDGKAISASYRSAFQSSRLFSVPSFMLAVSVVCAETEEEAVRCAVQGASLFTGPLSDDAEYRGRAIIGTPDRVCQQLHEMCVQYGADELIVVTTTGDYKSRLRSYELLSRMF